MHSVKLRVRAVLRHVAVEFERDVLMSAKPFVGLAVGLGRKGEGEPLFLAESSWSAVLQEHVCRAEDDLAADDFASEADSLAAVYKAGGWREVARASLMLRLPKKRRTAS
jgi:hypothetical protein